MCEYHFVQKFISQYKKEFGKAFQARGKNQSTYADCEVIFNNTVVKLEAKLLRNIQSNSSHFYNLLGEIIGLSLKGTKLKNLSISNVASGFLIPNKSKPVFDNLWQKNISKNNGNLYCCSFNVVFLFTYDENDGTIKVFKYCPTNNTWI